jgi:hypothetical protein
MIALTDRQKDSLDLLARNICRHRIPNKKNSKITSSSILRCLTDIFMEKWNSFNCAGITTEEELLKRIKGQLFND